MDNIKYTKNVAIYYTDHVKYAWVTSRNGGGSGRFENMRKKISKTVLD